jgi:hypothetical protein
VVIRLVRVCWIRRASASFWRASLKLMAIGADYAQ